MYKQLKPYQIREFMRIYTDTYNHIKFDIKDLEKWFIILWLQETLILKSYKCFIKKLEREMTQIYKIVWEKELFNFMPFIPNIRKRWRPKWSKWIYKKKKILKIEIINT